MPAARVRAMRSMRKTSVATKEQMNYNKTKLRRRIYMIEKNRTKTMITSSMIAALIFVITYLFNTKFLTPKAVKKPKAKIKILY